MKVYYAGSVNLATGAIINPGNARGSETSNPAALGLALNESLNEPTFDSLFKWVFGATWQWQTFDFNRDVDSVDQVLAADLNATSTDLRSFAGNGGKLILYAGWADPLIPSQSSINYFNALVSSYGGTHYQTALPKTQQFARLFMAPGMWHCNGGPGPNSFGGAIQQPPPTYDAQNDLLTSLTQWVEKGARAEFGHRHQIQQRRAPARHHRPPPDLLVSEDRDLYRDRRSECRRELHLRGREDRRGQPETRAAIRALTENRRRRARLACSCRKRSAYPGRDAAARPPAAHSERLRRPCPAVRRRARAL